jgi:pyridoxine 5-phosphate synthase
MQKKICLIKNLQVNLEISIKDEIVKNALKIKPNFICIVPENRKEITTEGGLNLLKNKNKIKKILDIFKKIKFELAFLLTQLLMMYYCLKN